MRKFLVVMILALGWSLLTTASLAQTTSPCPVGSKTKLESMEDAPGTIVIKGSTQIGTLAAKGGTLVVRSREVTDLSIGQQEFGLAIGITQGERPRDTTLIDYDEMDSFLQAIDYLGKVDWSVTALSNFDAGYITKGWLRVAALGNRRENTIEFELQSCHVTPATVLLTRSQFAELRRMIEQAKTSLDAIRTSK